MIVTSCQCSPKDIQEYRRFSLAENISWPTFFNQTMSVSLPSIYSAYVHAVL